MGLLYESGLKRGGERYATNSDMNQLNAEANRWYDKSAADLL